MEDLALTFARYNKKTEGSRHILIQGRTTVSSDIRVRASDIRPWVFFEGSSGREGCRFGTPGRKSDLWKVEILIIHTKQYHVPIDDEVNELEQ